MGKKLNYGSLCYTEIVAQAKNAHPAFSRAQNGKVYFNIDVWLNDEPDKLGNTISVSLSKKKGDDIKSVTIGNLKVNEQQPQMPISKPTEQTVSKDDDLPF
jgi:hypothetical protein